MKLINKIRNMDNNKKLPKPAHSDFEKRRMLEKSFNEGKSSEAHQDEYMELINSYDWSPDHFEKDGKYGLKTALGEIVLAPSFDDFKLLTSTDIEKGDRVVAELNGKWGVVIADGVGTWLIKPDYDYIGFPNYLTPVCKDSKWGVLDILKNEYLIPLECDSLSAYNGFIFTNGIGYYTKGGKTGVITSYGAFTEPIFEEVEGAPEGWVKVKYNGQWGFINEQNQFTNDEDEAYYGYDD